MNLLAPDDAGDHRAGVNAEADLAGLRRLALNSKDVEHLEGQRGHGLGVVAARFRHAAAAM